jgi:hypothetical protein
MKVDYSRFSLGGLHGKHVVETWKRKTGIIPAFALGPRKTKKNLCRDGRSQDLQGTDLALFVQWLGQGCRTYGTQRSLLSCMLQWNIFTHYGAVWSVDWIFIFGAPNWRWLSEYVTLGRTFYSLLLKQEAVAAHRHCHNFFHISFLEEAFIWNVVFIKR